jgi:hypothetical protein
MRRLLSIVALAVLAAGCNNPCQDLGDRLCKCLPVGTTTETCKREVDNAVKAADPTKDQDRACSDYLDSCNAPAGVDFCDWILTAEGEIACGLAYPPAP